MLGEDHVLSYTKHTIAQQHLQFHGKCLSNLEESGCLGGVVGGRRKMKKQMTQRSLKRSSQRKITKAKRSLMKGGSQLMTSGGRISIERINQLAILLCVRIVPSDSSSYMSLVP